MDNLGDTKHIPSMGFHERERPLLSERLQAVWRLLQARGNIGPTLDCTLCGWHGPSLKRGLHPAERHCPRCKSSNRHRLAAWVIDHLSLAGPQTAVLHVAPEASLGRRLASTAGRYVTCDLARHDVDHRIDLQLQTIGDGIFGLIVINHVLEHVPDDRAALCNLARMLAPGGVCLISVPMRPGGEPTDDDPSVVSPAARRARFGQDDHCRIYGPDFADRVREAGMATRLFGSADADPDAVAAHSMGGETLFLGSRVG